VLPTDDNLRPAVLGNATSLGGPSVPSGSPALARLEKGSGVEDRHHGWCDGVYLAQAIPVASAISKLTIQKPWKPYVSQVVGRRSYKYTFPDIESVEQVTNILRWSDAKCSKLVYEGGTPDGDGSRRAVAFLYSDALASTYQTGGNSSAERGFVP
jgi:hypothetical protein